jgi:hypothetical protein
MRSYSQSQRKAKQVLSYRDTRKEEIKVWGERGERERESGGGGYLKLKIPT